MKHSSNSINQIIIQPDHVINFDIIQAGNMVTEPPNIIRDQRMDKIIVLGHFFFTPKKKFNLEAVSFQRIFKNVHSNL